MLDKLVLVTGATGVIGPIVVNALLQAGLRVRTLSVDAPVSGMFPSIVENVTGDITNKVDVESVMQGVDSIIHLAALLHIVETSPDLRDKYELINIGGTEIVIEAAIKANVKRIIFFSTIAVYGHTRGQVINEQSPTNPETFYARTKLEAEQIVLNAKREDGKPLGIVFRLGAVYGSRIKGNYERLTHALAYHRFIPIGSGHNRRTLIYDKDVGHAVVLALSHPFAAGKIFNVTDGEFHTLNEIIESICFSLGRKLPKLSLPVDLTRTLVSLIEKGCSIINLKPSVTRAMIDKYTEDIAVDGSLIQKELGFIPQYDIKAGWEETIKEMRKSGAL
ncbi:MAG: NAD-dependent epimerase/dehydratase family protein [Desulfamplus sp.]|nr:NAD-dependent epimerase/dehydratase family protein [Desulfamplus sp.]